jgi:predicted DNA-binding transcriptional regulator YafY
MASHLDRMAAQIGAGVKPHKDYSRFSELMETVGKALIEHRHLDIRYHSMGSGKVSMRRIAPYHLWFFDNTFYLIAHCRQRNDMRTFAIDRMRACHLTDERFAVPDTFDPKAYMSDSFGIFKGKPVTVRVRFSPAAAGYIRERTWHHSQRLVETADGSLLFEADVADSDEIRTWVLGWGANAEVLAPDSLREAVKRHVRGMAERYESDG